jgi:Protein of unknown function DUF262
MEVLGDTWNLFTVLHRKSKIDPRPQYQRAPVWSDQKQQLLIDSVLRNYDMPKVYLRRLPVGSAYQHEVTDGQQRLLAIWRFMEGRLPLGPTSADIPDLGDLAGATYADLDEVARDRVGLFKLSIAEIRDASEEEIRDLFLRLQDGESLNPAEKRNAMMGGMRDFVADLAETHAVFPLTELPSVRYAWHDLAAMAACLEIAGGPTDLKAPSLRRMYDDYRDFDPEGDLATRVRAVLDYMESSLRSGPPVMNIKWGFVDLYLAISRLLQTNDLDGLQPDFYLMFSSFERDRRAAVSDPAQLLGPSGEPGDEDMYRYIEAFVRDGATERNVTQRHDVYLRRIARDIPQLQRAQ